MKNKVFIVPLKHSHLKHGVTVEGKLVGEHSVLETAEKHKNKILKPKAKQ